MQIGFAGLLAIPFIALKLTGVIVWSWLRVLSLLWIGFGIWVVVVAGPLLWAVLSGKPSKKRR